MAGFRITTLHAWVAIDPRSGDEGVVGQLMSDGTWMPMIGANEDRIKSMEPHARAIAEAAHQTIRLARFSVREDVEEIVPDGTGARPGAS